MPKFYTRMRREYIGVEMVDVEITANSAEEAKAKIDALFGAIIVESSTPESFESEVDGSKWDGNTDWKEWEGLYDLPLSEPLDDPESLPVNLDPFTVENHNA